MLIRGRCCALKEPILQEVKYRKVLCDDKKGRQKVEVEQLAAWKFLMFSGSFATRLYVFQDKQQRTVSVVPHNCINTMLPDSRHCIQQ